MNSHYRTASVFVRNVFARLLSEADDGCTFICDPGYLSSADASTVSLTLPLNRNVLKSRMLFPFFDKLIPEGWLLDVVKRNRKLDPLGGTKRVQRPAKSDAI